MAARLTDQALVAVALARRSASQRGVGATAVDLLLGLAAEEEGQAGATLRRHPRALVSLAGRAVSPRMPALEVALSWAAAEAGGRPLSTGDLLDATLDVGGTELGEFLGAAGLERAALRRPDRGPARDPRLLLVEHTGDESAPDSDPETVGLPARGQGTAKLTPAAALALARARAVDDSAADLLLTLRLADEDDWPPVGAAQLFALSSSSRRLPLIDSDAVVAAALQRDPGRRLDCTDLLVAIADHAAQGSR